MSTSIYLKHIRPTKGVVDGHRLMGTGRDEDVEVFEEDINKPLTQYEKMLDWHNITAEDFSDLSKNEQSRMEWLFRKTGRKSS